jgi:hypothetical protein
MCLNHVRSLSEVPRRVEPDQSTPAWCRGTFDKAVSSGPLAFAADAAPMGIQCCFGTFVLSFGGNCTMPVVANAARR